LNVIKAIIIICIYIYVYMYTYIYINAYIYIHVRMCVFMFVCAWLCACVCVFVYMNVCMSALEASWRRVFDPVATLLFDLYHYLDQIGAFDEYQNSPQVIAASSFLVAGFDTR